jgi:hypothetical protein
MSQERLGYIPENQYQLDDLEHALAIVVHIPDRFTSSPAKGVSDADAFDAYVRQWQEDIANLVLPHLPRVDRVPEFAYYPAHPDSGPYRDFILAIAQGMDAIVQTLDAYIGLGSALIALARRRKEIDDPEQKNSYSWNPMTFMIVTASAAEAMCLHHAHSEYYDQEKRPAISVQSSVRGEPMGSENHPTPNVQYTVKIGIGKSDYVYVMQADCRIVDHFRISAGVLEPLELPDWFQEMMPWDAQRKMGKKLTLFRYESASE